MTKNIAETAPSSPEKECSLEGSAWEMVSDLKYIESAVDALESKLQIAGWDRDSIHWLAVGLREVIANAIIHGNLDIQERKLLFSDPIPVYENWATLAEAKIKAHPELRNKRVYISLSISPDEVVISVRDEGKGFDPQKIPDPTATENLLANTGRGLFDSLGTLDEVRYDFENGTEVTLVKRKQKKRPEAA